MSWGVAWNRLEIERRSYPKLEAYLGAFYVPEGFSL